MRKSEKIDINKKIKKLGETQARPFQEEGASESNNMMELFQSGKYLEDIPPYSDHLSMVHFGAGRLKDIEAAMDNGRFTLKKLFKLAGNKDDYDKNGITTRDDFAIQDLYIFFGDRFNEDFNTSQYKDLSDKQLDRYFQVMSSLSGRYKGYLDKNFKNHENGLVQEQRIRAIQVWFKFVFLALGFNATQKLEENYSFRGTKQPLHKIISTLAKQYPEEFKSIKIDENTIEAIDNKIGLKSDTSKFMREEVQPKVPVMLARAQAIQKYFADNLGI